MSVDSLLHRQPQRCRQSPPTDRCRHLLPMGDRVDRARPRHRQRHLDRVPRTDPVTRGPGSGYPIRAVVADNGPEYNANASQRVWHRARSRGSGSRLVHRTTTPSLNGSKAPCFKSAGGQRSTVATSPRSASSNRSRRLADHLQHPPPQPRRLHGIPTPHRPTQPGS